MIKIAFQVLLGTLFVFTGQVFADKIPVFVSIVPQKYFVEQIGKTLVDVQVMVPPGANPATYEPKPRQMAAIHQAKIYFSIGVPFEKVWLKKIAASNRKMMMVDTDHGIQKPPMAAYHHNSVNEHADDENHHHAHGALDPHIWLSPPLVMTQARTILNALQTVDPAHGPVYEANYKAFIAMLAELNNELKNTFMGKHGLQFMVFHPAWGVFAHTYGLKQVPVEIQGKDPKPAQLQALIEHAKQHRIKVIFAQPQFSSKSAQLIAKAIGGRVVFADPLALDWPQNLRKLADTFKRALR